MNWKFSRLLHWLADNVNVLSASWVRDFKSIMLRKIALCCLEFFSSLFTFLVWNYFAKTMPGNQQPTASRLVDRKHNLILSLSFFESWRNAGNCWRLLYIPFTRVLRFQPNRNFQVVEELRRTPSSFPVAADKGSSLNSISAWNKTFNSSHREQCSIGNEGARVHEDDIANLWLSLSGPLLIPIAQFC